jgi:hypothetical protein
MRYNPEPTIKPEVDPVRAELAQLLAEPSRGRPTPATMVILNQDSPAEPG